MVHPLPRAASPAVVDLAFRASSTLILVRPVFFAIAAAETPIRDNWWYASASSASVSSARWMFSTTCVTMRSASSGLSMIITGIASRPASTAARVRRWPISTCTVPSSLRWAITGSITPCSLMLAMKSGVSAASLRTFTSTVRVAGSSISSVGVAVMNVCPSCPRSGVGGAAMVTGQLPVSPVVFWLLASLLARRPTEACLPVRARAEKSCGIRACEDPWLKNFRTAGPGGACGIRG